MNKRKQDKSKRLNIDKIIEQLEISSGNIKSPRINKISFDVNMIPVYEKPDIVKTSFRNSKDAV